ncbi:MAG: hypothetical protein CL484_09330 [Acidobacteria bacterium]|nr:hypothetical protein [Acidobacteriota bacterium]|tara:strand:+ start:1385 stop:1840 length:456 start_codon:yes stop_codon:yes gene_type:complete
MLQPLGDSTAALAKEHKKTDSGMTQSEPSFTSMNYLIFAHVTHQFIDRFEVRNLKRANRLYRKEQRLVHTARVSFISQPRTCLPELSKHLRPIEPLTFTMLTKTHGLLPLSSSLSVTSLAKPVAEGPSYSENNHTRNQTLFATLISAINNP